MKAKFRQVFVYSLDVEAGRSGASLPTMTDLITVLDRRRLAGQAHIPIQSGDVEVILGDVVIDHANQHATLLIRQSDRHYADSVYSNFGAGVFRTHTKVTGEGGETGGHAFISLAPEQGIPNRYTCIVEKVPGLDVTLMRRLLNRILHGEYDDDPTAFSFPNPAGARTRAGTVRIDRCLPRMEFQARPSKTLADDVQNGRLTGITLSRAVTHTPVGGVPYITKREAFLKLDIDHNSLSGNVWGDVRKALRAEAVDYPTAQIGIRLPGRKKTVSVKVDSANGSPLSDVYIQSFDIDNISPPMAQSAQAVVPQFAARVLPLLTRERNV